MIYFIILTLIAIVVLIMGFLEFQVPFMSKKKAVKKFTLTLKPVITNSITTIEPSEIKETDLMSAECAAFFKLPIRIKI